jgi:mannitol-1-/sugar-/sorbitol-6-/2-deoxyglucose-6-phosphatase
MPGAIIFDMDGLLIDSEPLWVRAEIEVFGAAGLPLREEDCARTKGLRVDDVVAYWHASTPSGFAHATPAEVEQRLIARVAELVAAEGRALSGVFAALAVARSNARWIALASSSPLPIIGAALERLGLASTFDVVHSAQNEPFGKPHPVTFLRTAERLEVSPLDCVVIEDSITGVIAAKAARMGCIAVPFDHPDHAAGFAIADVVLGSLESLTAEVLERAAPRRR